MAGSKVFSKDGIERRWLKDGDEVIFDGWVEMGGVKFGFGLLTGTILPTIELKTN